MNREELIKQVIILILVIAGSVILVRHFTGGETLLEYANDNNIPIHSEVSEPDNPANK